MIVAAVVYFALILPMNHFMAKRKSVDEVAAEAEVKEVVLLAEIRDALVNQR